MVIFKKILNLLDFDKPDSNTSMNTSYVMVEQKPKIENSSEEIMEYFEKEAKSSKEEKKENSKQNLRKSKLLDIDN